MSNRFEKYINVTCANCVFAFRISLGTLLTYFSKSVVSFRFNSGYTEAATLRGHTSFVSCVCVLPPSKDFRDGLILTGGCDKKICVFQLNSFDPFLMLEDHKDNGMSNFYDRITKIKPRCPNLQPAIYKHSN